jgi:hypothetical protein
MKILCSWDQATAFYTYGEGDNNPDIPPSGPGFLVIQLQNQVPMKVHRVRLTHL